MIVIGTPVLPFYIKHKGVTSLLYVLKKHIWPLIIIAPLIPIIFVKSSLPPYFFDEMAYHYLSPRGLQQIITWNFDAGGLYQNLPRSLETLYYIIFALFKTYSPARLLHFLVLFSVFSSISIWLKKRVGILSSIFFIALYFYLPQDLLTPATLGYVDIGAISITSLAIITLIDFFITKKTSILSSSLVFWFIALGIKYTSVIPFFSYLVVTIFILLLNYNRLKTTLIKKIITASILGIFLGGFWYVKNFYLFHNPIYPFIFSCADKFATNCQTTSGFFGGWTQAINLKELPRIFSTLMAGQKTLGYLFLFNLFLFIFQKNKRLRLIVLTILSATFIEFIILKYFSGFYIRYFQDIQILLILTLTLQLPSLKYPQQTFKWYLYLYTIILGGVILLSGYRTLRYRYYQSSYLPKYEVQYSRGQLSIGGWVSLKFPKMKDFIFLCDKDSQFSYVWLDPDLIWFEYAGMSRVFMTNCQQVGNSLDGISISKIRDTALAKKIEFIFPSVNLCLKPDKIKYLGYENNQQKYLRQLTNEILCHSTEIAPHIYKFSYLNY